MPASTIPDLVFHAPVSPVDLVAAWRYVRDCFPDAKSVELVIDGRGSIVHVEVIPAGATAVDAIRRTFKADEISPTASP